MSSITVAIPPRRALDIFIIKTFKLSRLFFTFPFYAINDTLCVSYKFLFLSVIALGYTSLVSIFFVKDLYITIPDPNVMKLSFYTPIAGFILIPICHLAWLMYSKNRIFEFFKMIQNVELETGYRTPDPGTKMISIVFIMLICNGIYSYTLNESPDIYVYIFGVCTIHFCILSIVIILAQFNALINLVKSQYRYILNTLDYTNVEKWCCCREQLSHCCRAISDCYAPQLLLMVTTNFASIVCDAYQFAVSAVIQTHWSVALNYAVWAFMYCLMTWFIIFLCDSTLSTARKFDNLVYYMIINDPTSSLVKNKRILIHFKAKRKEEFSAMGFFNFDYPLLCSMVSSATTYIVILVQFS